MTVIAFAAPVLEGKDAHTITNYFRAHMEDYEESRRRNGITMERAFVQPTPMGSFLVAYIEAEKDFGALSHELVESDLEIDKFFVEKIKEIHGLDVSAPPPGPLPELLGEWRDPEVMGRKQGLAFVSPLL